MRSPRHRALSLALLLSLVACGDGASSSCDGFACGDSYFYPQSQLENGVDPVDEAVTFRLTQAGLDFLLARLPALLEGLDDTFVADPLNPAFLRIEVASEIVVNDSPRIALGVDDDGEHFRPSVFWLRRAPLLDELRFLLVEGDPEGVAAHIEDLVIGVDARAYTSFGVSEAACDVLGANDAVCPPEAASCAGLGLVTTLTFDLFITPRIASGAECDDPALGNCFRVDVDVANLVMGEFDSSSLDIDAATSCAIASPAPDCDGECSDTVPFVDEDGDNECQATCAAGDFIASMVGGLNDAIEGVLESFLDGIVEDAMNDALADIDGMPATASSRLDVAELAGDLLSPSTLDLGYMLAPDEQQTFDVNCAPATDCASARGLDVVLRTGLEAAPEEGQLFEDPPHACVELLDGARFAALYGADEFIAPTDEPLTGELNGEPYHLGLSLARAALNQALYGAYNAGALCIELDSEDVHALAGGAFQLSAGTLDTLTGGRLKAYTPPTAPAVVGVVPREPPVVRFGAGDESEGHLLVSWSDVRIDFYVWYSERFARLFAVDVDLSLELTALYDAGTEELELSISRGPTLEGFTEVYSELLPDVEFGEVLEGLLGSLIDQLLADQLSFAFPLGLGELLSQAAEVPLAVEIRAIETTGGSERLNLYFDLVDGTASPQLPSLLGEVTVASLEGGALVVGGGGARIPDGLTALARVDGGAWYGPFASGGGVIALRHPKLTLPGRHAVELRARPRGAQRGWIVRDLDVDVAAATSDEPRVTLERQGGSVVARSDARELAWGSNGVWGPFGSTTALALDALDGVRLLSVRARGDDGRVSRPVTIDLATRAWR